jgi:hypothetical protein
MGSPLESVRAKIKRAQTHFDEIDSSLQTALSTESQIKPIVPNSDLKRQKQLLISLNKVGIIDSGLPLVIGDCIHNLRSALDHLVYQLAILSSAPVDAAEKTMFPVCLTKDGKSGFDERVRSLVAPFISGAALAEIEMSQPYKTYNIPEESDIWVLHKLDIIDKHRLLIVARQHYAMTWFRVTVPTGEVFEKAIPKPQWKPLEDGAEIIRFDLSGALPAPGEVKRRCKRPSLYSSPTPASPATECSYKMP